MVRQVLIGLAGACGTGGATLIRPHPSISNGRNKNHRTCEINSLEANRESAWRVTALNVNTDGSAAQDHVGSALVGAARTTFTSIHTSPGIPRGSRRHPVGFTQVLQPQYCWCRHIHPTLIASLLIDLVFPQDSPFNHSTIMYDPPYCAVCGGPFDHVEILDFSALGEEEEYLKDFAYDSQVLSSDKSAVS